MAVHQSIVNLIGAKRGIVKKEGCFSAASSASFEKVVQNPFSCMAISANSVRSFVSMGLLMCKNVFHFDLKNCTYQKQNKQDREDLRAAGFKERSFSKLHPSLSSAA
jgi:hypothetical protein